MKKWKEQVKIPKGRGEMSAGIFDVIEHTDEECNEPRTDGQHLAPYSHGFVCLYQNGKYKGWCGVNFARERTINYQPVLEKPSKNLKKRNTDTPRRRPLDNFSTTATIEFVKTVTDEVNVIIKLNPKIRKWLQGHKFEGHEHPIYYLTYDSHS